MVCPRVKTIRVSAGDGHLLSSTASSRFAGATEVYIYSLLEELEHRGRNELFAQAQADRVSLAMAQGRMLPNLLRLCRVTAGYAARFLCAFPSLKFAFIGGLCTCEDGDHERAGCGEDQERVDLSYSPYGRYDLSDHRPIYAALLRDICTAYRTGRLATSVSLGGIVPAQRPSRAEQFAAMQDGSPLQCAWGCAGKDEGQGLCAELCATFPPATVAAFRPDTIPCVPNSEAVLRACRRQPDLPQRALRRLFECEAGFPVLLPPDFSHHDFAFQYLPEDLNQMAVLIEAGADIRDPLLRRLVVEGANDTGGASDGTDDETSERGLGFGSDRQKRLVTLGTVNALRQLGLELTTEEVEIIDERDERVVPMYNRPQQLYRELAYAAGEHGQAEDDEEGESDESDVEA